MIVGQDLGQVRDIVFVKGDRCLGIYSGRLTDGVHDKGNSIPPIMDLVDQSVCV